MMVKVQVDGIGACVGLAGVSISASAEVSTRTQVSLRIGERGWREWRRSLCGLGKRTQLPPAATDGASACTQVSLIMQNTVRLPGCLWDLSRHGQLAAVLGPIALLGRADSCISGA